MPRPPDNYTHAQFELIETDNIGETVRCIHCKNWQGSVKTLNRKKEHLLRCPQYAQWRQAGNGRDLQPPNQYTKRDSFPLMSKPQYDSPSQSANGMAAGNTHNTPTVIRPKISLDINKYFDEFADADGQQKCVRVRCHFCGFVRAKNTTRQIEHLLQCGQFLDTTDGQAAQAELNRTIEGTPAQNRSSVVTPGKDIWRGHAPNPNLITPSSAPAKTTAESPELRPFRNVKASRQPFVKKTASLAVHLISKTEGVLEVATRHPFLTRAGRGTLPPVSLSEWLAQLGYISRGLIPFVGALIAKVRIPENSNLQQDSMFRALDLLCSAANNAKKELEFLEGTKAKYGLGIVFQEPSPAAKGFVDLFASATLPSASFLEGMVVLWALEHLLVLSFQHAHAARQPDGSAHSNPYSLPSYMGAPPQANHFAAPPPNFIQDQGPHNALIQNWTSDNFIRFVDACRSIVDELANGQTAGNGHAEMVNCERAFRQSSWLWGQMWPQVSSDGTDLDTVGGGERASGADDQNTRLSGNNHDGLGAPPMGISSSDDKDEDEDEDADIAETNTPSCSCQDYIDHSSAVSALGR